jgi:hypothetical protein
LILFKESGMKVPAIIASSIIFLFVGVGVGAVGATYLKLTTDALWFWNKGDAAEGAKDVANVNAPPMPPMGGGKGMGGGFGGPPGMGGKGGGGFGGGGKGPSAKTQLNTLVAKLDHLTQKPLTVSLDDEQKKQVQEQLQGLGALDELTEDDAKKRLDGLLDVLKTQKETLSVAGFQWPGEKGGGFQGPKDVANPFKDEPNARHLQSLEQRLGKAAP